MSNTTQTEDFIYVSNASASGAIVGTDTTTSFPQTSVVQSHKLPARSTHDKKIERAVYSHIRAIRALGRTRINTSDIADALSLKVSEVNSAVAKLKRKGVRNI
jgi:hypothetical protein